MKFWFTHNSGSFSWSVIVTFWNVEKSMNITCLRRMSWRIFNFLFQSVFFSTSGKLYFTKSVSKLYESFKLSSWYTIKNRLQENHIPVNLEPVCLLYMPPIMTFCFLEVIFHEGMKYSSSANKKSVNLQSVVNQYVSWFILLVLFCFVALSIRESQNCRYN